MKIARCTSADLADGGQLMLVHSAVGAARVTVFHGSVYEKVFVGKAAEQFASQCTWSLTKISDALVLESGGKSYLLPPVVCATELADSLEHKMKLLSLLIVAPAEAAPVEAAPVEPAPVEAAPVEADIIECIVDQKIESDTV